MLKAATVTGALDVDFKEKIFALISTKLQKSQALGTRTLIGKARSVVQRGVPELVV